MLVHLFLNTFCSLKRVMESVLVPLPCKIINPNYEKMKRIDFLSDHDESSRSVQIMSIRQHWIPQVNAYLCVVYFCDLSTMNTPSQRLSMYCLLLVIDSRWHRSTFLMTSPVDPCESTFSISVFYIIFWKWTSGLFTLFTPLRSNLVTVVKIYALTIKESKVQNGEWLKTSAIY